MYHPQHQFQRFACRRGQTPIINLASKEDPADLALDFDAINMDIQEFDEETQTDLTSVPNFVRGDVRAIPFNDNYFGTVVLGECLEHMTEEAARETLLEAKRVMKRTGQMVVTFPLDTRTPEEQKVRPEERKEVAPGCYTYHVSVWTADKLRPLLEEVGLRIVMATEFQYNDIMGGVAMLLAYGIE